MHTSGAPNVMVQRSRPRQEGYPVHRRVLLLHLTVLRIYRQISNTITCPISVPSIIGLAGFLVYRQPRSYMSVYRLTNIPVIAQIPLEQYIVILKC